MPHRWPADTDFRLWELDVLDRDCASCGRMMHICDHRYRHFYTLEGPVELICKLNHCPKPDCPGHARLGTRTQLVIDSNCVPVSTPMSDRPWETTRRPRRSVGPLDKYNVGEVVGPPAISPSKIILAVAERPLFPPLDQALIQAMACEVVADTKSSASPCAPSDP